jgi:hypothetical protein
MDEMTNDDLDVRRIELGEESANWRHLAANSDIVETLGAALNDIRDKHAALMADLPKAKADHAAAVAGAMLRSGGGMQSLEDLIALLL